MLARTGGGGGGDPPLLSTTGNSNSSNSSSSRSSSRSDCINKSVSKGTRDETKLSLPQQQQQQQQQWRRRQRHHLQQQQQQQQHRPSCPVASLLRPTTTTAAAAATATIPLLFLLLLLISPAAGGGGNDQRNRRRRRFDDGGGGGGDTLFRGSVVHSSSSYPSSSSQLFHNQFAVLVPKGPSTADALAARHGFVNLGQIGALENYFLFEHARWARGGKGEEEEGIIITGSWIAGVLASRVAWRTSASICAYHQYVNVGCVQRNSPSFSPFFWNLIVALVVGVDAYSTSCFIFSPVLPLAPVGIPARSF